MDDENPEIKDPKDIDPSRQLERLLEEVVDLLQFTVENADKPIKPGRLPRDIFAKIEKLESQVQTFCDLNDSLIAKFNKDTSFYIDPNPSTEEKMENLTKQEQRVIERTKMLTKLIEEKKEFLRSWEEQFKDKGESPVEPPKIEDTKNPIISRKKQFKRVGGNKNWKPL